MTDSVVVNTEQTQKMLKRLDRLAWLMDKSIGLPGGFRIGIDGLIGLIPGVGDVIGLLISLYLFVLSLQIKTSTAIKLKMLWNIALEFFIGSIPILGDLFDFYFKANVRNVDLLKKHLSTPQNT
jgi:hypothetical protein